MNKKVYVTQQGLEELKKELEELSTVKRPQVLEDLSQARNQGDLSENSEYTSARDELALIDTRLDELEEMLRNVELIDEDKGGNSVVHMGSTVKVKSDGKEYTYTLVGEVEANPEEGKISISSPLGKALIGKKVGESVQVEAPAGTMSYTIVSIA
jgi:transcription elongation factor GreA